MNSRKKIINTLKKADKSSVDRLMAEEMKKNEIFAKVQRRVNIEQSEYTDVVNGVERYERRINMIKIASIAAAAVLTVGSIGGGAYVFKNKKTVEPDGDSNKTTITTESTSQTGTTETTIVSGTGSDVTNSSSGGTNSSVTTVTVTVDPAAAANNNSATGTVTGGGSSGNNAQSSGWSVSREELTEKFNNYASNISRFSADYTQTNASFPNAVGQVYAITTNGTMYMDARNDTVYLTGETYYDDDLAVSMVALTSGGYDISAYINYMDSPEGIYNMVTLDVPKKTYSVLDRSKYTEMSSNGWVYHKLENSKMPKLDQEGNNWEITDERIEDGRKVVYISGDFDSPDEYTDLIDRYSYVAKIDAETGICLYVKYDYWWNRPEYTVELTNCRFEENASQPMSRSDMKSLIKNGGYERHEYSDFDIDSIGW